MTVLASLGANDCPACRANHEHLDVFWACPRHGHKLGAPIADGDWEHRRCPAAGCIFFLTARRPPRNPAKGDPMTAVASRPSVPVDMMYDRAAHLKQLLPAGLDVDSFIGSAAAGLYNNAKLMEAAEASPDSLYIALTECAALGHFPASKEYYLTPRKDHGRPKVLGIEGYRGIVERMYRSGQVGKVTVREVCENDLFDFIEGQHDVPSHSFGRTDPAILAPTGADFFGKDGSIDRGPMVGVYAYAKLLTGEYTRVSLLWPEDVYAARDSGGYKPDDQYSPWNRMDGGPSRPEFKGRSMWWKTALKRAEPWTPTSAADKRAPAGPSVHAEQVPQRPSVTLTAPPAPAPAAVQDKRQALPAGRSRSRRGPTAATAGTASTPTAGPSAAERPANDSVVIKALNAAIGKQFDRLGLEDDAERLVYAGKLANKPEVPIIDLTEDDLRFVLDSLRDCEDLAALIDLCAAEAS